MRRHVQRGYNNDDILIHHYKFTTYLLTSVPSSLTLCRRNCGHSRIYICKQCKQGQKIQAHLSATNEKTILASCRKKLEEISRKQ